MNSLMLPKVQSCVYVNRVQATSVRGTDPCQDGNNKTKLNNNIWPDGATQQQDQSTEIGYLGKCYALLPNKVRLMIYWSLLALK